MCSAHYYRWSRHGDPLAGGTSPGEPAKFFREVVMTYVGDECLRWPYATDRKGYAMMTVDGRNTYVCRIICEEVNGPPPTPAHEAAHSCGCGQLGCVTKGHLSWKTRLENKEDELIHGTRNRGERNGIAKLTRAQAEEILSLKGKVSAAEIARRLSVSRQTVYSIWRGDNWGWLNG